VLRLAAVKHGDIVTISDERANDVPANEPGTAEDYDPHDPSIAFSSTSARVRECEAT
jgi:hypothetical protein